ncbi:MULTISPECIES: hypothetical protein [unclassified Novosphingobium]|uniref:hypothetical protein n=1 Tax=unclassified Novosphingobium TaxID=2644732 RepID=UPI00146EF29F|nr:MULTISPECIES: hypothetical protein [unclassified Novosphingobium]NMN06749.1 hypothetical protein [Novosphingobium sp. SG919]NMN88800.1 hypothetical protein [Novosphingobium sp. SG916]
MTDYSAPGASARLYSQTNHDERGNFHYQGDLYRAGDNLATLAARIEGHLKAKFPATSFAIRTEKFAGGRKITAEILDTPTDLTPRDAQNSFFVEVRDQMERFGFTRSNLLQDFHTCSFYCEACISQAYWAAQAARCGAKNPVQAKVTLAAFKKQVRAGDRLKLIDAPAGHRALGTTRAIAQVRSGDMILEGRSYLTFPRASAFACDGKFVRISIGSEYDPGAHLLYEWLRHQAV